MYVLVCNPKVSNAISGVWKHRPLCSMPNYQIHRYGTRSVLRYTIYTQKYVDTPSNEWIWPFLPHTLLRSVYNLTHSNAISIDKHWQKNVLTEELSDFQCGNVIGCHLSNKSVCLISALLELPRSTVSAVIVKWKLLGATTAQPQSGWSHKLTEQDRRVSSVETLTSKFQTASGSNVSPKNCSSGAS